MEQQKRSSFTGKLGFVLTAAGSAVGLGNIWRFPYLAAKYGGGIFLLVYIVLAITFGFALMIGEIALGRKTGLSAIGAFSKMHKKFTFVGILESIVPMIILPYYSVIGGWVCKYFVVSVSGKIPAAANDEFFGAFISKTYEPLGWFFLFLAATSLIVMLGVEKGIEKASKFLMPVLVVLTLFVAIYSLFMPGALDGVVYYLKPDFSKFSVNTVLAAMGQLFYSMSLAMGIMITYGSYMKKEVDLESSARQIEIFDTGIAFLAGLMIIPSVFAFSGGNEEALGKGPSLMFITLPKVFNHMPGGNIIGTAFFLLVLFAALTSSISLMEAVVSNIHDILKIDRKVVCFIVFAVAVLLGLPSSLGFGIWSSVSVLGMSILDMFDFISNSVMMPIVAFFTSIFIGFFVGTKPFVDEVKISSKFRGEKLFTVIIKYIAPICILLILISSLLDTFGIVKL